MGIVGAILVARWSISLLKTTSAILLDEQASENTRNSIQEIIEADANNRIVDLHLWIVGPGVFSAIVSIVSTDPQQPDHYKLLIEEHITLHHLSVEVHTYEEA